MPQNIFFIPKYTDTYADAFTAFGLAGLLDRIFQQTKGPDTPRSIELVDTGGHYEIRLRQPLEEKWVENISFFRSPAPYLTGQKEQEFPPDTTARDVDATWKQVRAYNEQRGALIEKGTRGTELEKQLEDQEPPHDWQVVAFLGDWRMQAQGIYNRFVSGWAQGRSHFSEHLQTILEWYSSENPAQENILKKWVKLAKQDGISYQDTASQLLNPHQGKGQNESKANVLRMDNIKDRPWIEEMLKTIGLWHGLAPRQISDTKDWKAYVIAPRSIHWSALASAYRRFNKYLWRERRGDATSLKTDITSILLFFRAWLDYVETETEEEDDNFDAETSNPQNVIQGFYVVQFKLLSPNAYTMVNQSFLGLPSWGSTIHTRRDLTEMKALIDEHLDVVRNLEESHSDGYDLLRYYREFVAGENWQAFFDFTTGYAQEILRRYNEGAKWVPTFTTIHLRRLFMSSKKPLSTILENQGFQNVAAAIRYSTVVPQSRKARQQDSLYDVRYGLGVAFKRKSTVRDEFVSALTDFMHMYNQENVQELENKGQQMRKDLRTSDIEEIIHLVDDYGSELVANLLVAYGYAREPREETPNS
ncbi:MAG: hypothetical protein Fur0022_39520 [Anaerolineales bacterium]